MMILALGGWDADALAFISAASITDATQKSAINKLVKGLKAHSLWSRIVALYPFVGGSASQHRYNLINPSNFLITFVGGVTHDANGVTFNGSTGYANTGLTPSSSLTLNNESLFLYSRTAAAGAVTTDVDMGAANTTTQRDELLIRNSANSFRSSLNTTAGGSGTVSTTTSDGSGLFMGTRISSTDHRVFRNSTQIGSTSTGSNGGTLSNIPIYIGARNVSNAGNGFVNRNFAMAGAGLGFNTTQVGEFYTLVQNFQTMLGRQV